MRSSTSSFLKEVASSSGPSVEYQTCWIVCGPESSGSVLVAKTISHAIGVSTDFNSWNGYGYNSEIGANNLVLHRSIPFMRPKMYHDDVQKEIRELKKHYSRINYILTTREPTISLISKKNRFGGTYEDGELDLEKGKTFFRQICGEPTCFIWSYESMQILGADYFKRLYSFYGISSDFIPEVRDANQKYIRTTDDIGFESNTLLETPIIYFINLFLKQGRLPDFQKQTINSLLNAINRASQVEVLVAVMVDPIDFKYFKALFKSHSAVIKVCKIGKASWGQRLPRIDDIIQSNIAVTLLGKDKAERSYCIYSNADICIPSYFFSYIRQQLIQSESCVYPKRATRGKHQHDTSISPDSFVINRRDIIGWDSNVESTLAWHPGSDLFVFPLRFLDRMNFGDVTIGIPPVAPIIWLNILLLSRRTLHVTDEFITWHHGNDQQWRSEEAKEEIELNTRAAALAFWNLIGGDKSIASNIRFEDSANARNLRAKSEAFIRIADEIHR